MSSVSGKNHKAGAVGPREATISKSDRKGDTDVSFANMWLTLKIYFILKRKNSNIFGFVIIWSTSF